MGRVIVEFVGPSGSGKTTVARAALAASQDLTWGRTSLAPDPTRVSRQTLARTLPGLIFTPLLAWRIVTDAAARPCWQRIGWRRGIKVLFLAARNRGQSGSARRYLHDQGVVQALAGRVRRWSKEDQLHALPILYRSVGLRSVPDVIVEFRVPPEVAAVRTKLEDSLNRDAYKVTGMAEAIHASVGAAGQAFGVPVVTTVNEGSAAITAQELVPLLARALRAPS